MASEYTPSGVRRAGDDYQDIIALDLLVLTTAELTPSSGQMLLVHRSLIERESAKLGGVFAWICRITTYHRKYSHRPFTETDFVLDFGTTRIVRDRAEE